ncbi:MAG TPA: tetratricopeptide repeat protein [Bacteroidetes bacterium]|nr:tetratricopeptide repeat protein [Bacteroidota bacterium]
MLLISSCGVKRKNFIAKGFHRTTTLFNYLYNGEIIWKEGVKQIDAAYRVPPEGYIPVWWAGTEDDATSFASNFESAIEKSEIALQKHNHPDNKWFDELRFLIGRSWFYKRNYLLAIKNFEHVIKTYPESKIIPDVYLWLVKTHYMDDNSTMALKLIEETLPKMELTKRQRGELAMVQAQVYLDEDKFDEVLRTLNADKKNIKGNTNRARAYFLLGQIYADRGDFSRAYENFHKVTKLNTDYELIFNAKLNIAKGFINEQNGTAEVKKLRRLLKKMLRDEKNIDYKDRVYYEMAMLDLKLNNKPAAIDNLQNAIAANTNNQRQKALSYYKIGQIYFYDLRDFTNAEVYFDSASTSITRDAPEYREISTISRTLKEYVGFVKTIHLQDSLLVVSNMSDGELGSYVDKLIADKEKREAEAQAQQIEELNQLNDPNLFKQFGENKNTKRSSEFYFDAPNLISNGRIEFQQRWGTRKNEDNWRRKNKRLEAAEEEEEVIVEVSEAEIKKYGSKERAQMIKNVPRTNEDRTAAHLMVSEALYGLGQVYQNKLDIPDSAIAVYGRLIGRYPDSEYSLKARYALFKLFKDQGKEDLAARYKAEICAKYPDSRYCKYCRGEQVEEATDEQNEEFISAYTALFSTYNRQEYETCIEFSNFITIRFPASAEIPKVYMIRGKAFGFMGQKDSLISIYEYIKLNYPESNVIPEVKRTLGLISGVPEGGPSTGGDTFGIDDPGKDNPKYKGFTLTRKPHEKVYVVMLLDKNNIKSNDLQLKINQFNKKLYQEKRLNVSIFLYRNKFHMPYISQFDDEQSALSYIKNVSKEPGISELFDAPTEKMVFISPANFRTAYGKKRFEDYFVFYENMVLKSLNGK